MATDQGPVVQSALLRSELVHLRKEKGLTQEHVAKNLEWSPSKLIRVEGGRSSITKVDLDALLARYGVTSESHRDKLHALNKGARERAWWDDFRGDINSTYLNYVGYEAGATFIRPAHDASGEACPAVGSASPVLRGGRGRDPSARRYRQGSGDHGEPVAPRRRPGRVGRTAHGSGDPVQGGCAQGGARPVQPARVRRWAAGPALYRGP